MAEGSTGAADASLGYHPDALLERHRRVRDRGLRRTAPRATTVEDRLSHRGSPQAAVPRAASQTSLRRAQPMFRRQDPRQPPAHATRTTRRTTDGV